MSYLSDHPEIDQTPLTIEEEVFMALSMRKLLARGMSMDEIMKALGPHVTEENRAIDTYWTAAWFDSGFPVLKVSPKWAAASMTTSVSKDVADELKSPWKAFVLELPRNEELLFMTIDGLHFPVSFIKAGCYPELSDVKKGPAAGIWAVTLVNRVNPYVLRSTAISLHIPDGLTLSEAQQVQHIRGSEPDILSVRLAGRMIASALCSMQTPKNLQKVGPASSKTKNERTGKEPTVYQITEPVTIDLTEHVRQYQLGTPGKGKKLELQLVVCGHRKNQPYGPRNSLRKPIWIPPYIRGPETAPMALRAHILKTE